MKKVLVRLLIRFFNSLRHFCYWAINQLVVVEGDGVHPKHHILRYHDFMLDNIKKSDSVIDIGCGTGTVAHVIAGKAKYVLGIDFDKSNISKAKKRYKKKNLRFVVADALDFKPEKDFDVIILSNVLEHIDDRVDLLKSLSSISNKLLLRVPLIERGWLPVYQRDHGLLYRLDRTHTIEFTIAGLHEELSAGGWDIVDSRIEFGEFLGVLEHKK